VHGGEIGEESRSLSSLSTVRSGQAGVASAEVVYERPDGR